MKPERTIKVRGKGPRDLLWMLRSGYFARHGTIPSSLSLLELDRLESVIIVASDSNPDVISVTVVRREEGER